MNKYKHKEAFCHMQYAGVSNGNRIFLSIWNSRDGVSPFTTYCKEYGVTMQHVNWQQDRIDPDYKPKKGDLIWVSHTEESAREVAENAYAQYLQLYEDVKDMTEEDMIVKYGYNIGLTLQTMLADKDQYIDEAVKRCLYEHGEPQPHLILVEEDWK